MYTTISRTSVLNKADSSLNPYLSTNWREHEFYHQGAAKNHPQQHRIATALIDAAQWLRSWSNSAMYVSSSIRYPGDKHYSATSQHTHGRAIDLNWYDRKAERQFLANLADDILNQGSIYQQLYALGIRRIGLYDDFIHLDTRPTIEMVVWDKRTYLKGVKPQPMPGYASPYDPEPRPTTTSVIETVTGTISGISVIASKDNEDGYKAVSAPLVIMLGFAGLSAALILLVILQLIIQ